jgi:hypothetical protein
VLARGFRLLGAGYSSGCPPIGDINQARYEARITAFPSGKKFTDRGTTPVLIQDIEEITLDQTTYIENFTVSFLSDLAEAEPLLPTTKEECKDGGFENFGFENQSDCVSFVITGGKNEPGKYQ